MSGDINDVYKPWMKPNDFGELPGDICCQRATGPYCYEHDKANYGDIIRKAEEYFRAALGGNMNIATLTPFAFAEIMRQYADKCIADLQAENKRQAERIAFLENHAPYFEVVEYDRKVALREKA